MKKTRLLLVLVLVFAMCLSFAPVAMAQPPYSEAAFTKLLQVPVGTEFPAMGFTFTFEPEQYNGSSAAPDLARIPIIGTAPGTSRTGVITLNMNRTSATLEGTVDRVSTYYLESPNFVAGVDFPNAGIYDYIVEESGTTYNITSALHEALELSLARYRVSVWIQENAAGERSVFHVGVVRITTEAGDPGSEKVDPTPGGGTEDTDYSQMTFINKYVRTNGAQNPNNPNPQRPPTTPPGGPTDPYTSDSTLNIGNTITGLLGSQNMPFDFTLRVNVPTLIQDYVRPFYKAYLVGSTGVLDPRPAVTNPALVEQDTSTNGYRYIRFAPDTLVEFQLTHGQTLVFVNTPVGTQYSVTQAAQTGYTTTITPIYNNETLAVETALAYTGLVGERMNAAYYTNAFGDNIPTGLNINDLPFYGLILLAVGGLVVFIIIKARKRNRS